MISHDGSVSLIQKLRNLTGLELEFKECSSLSNETFEKITKGLTDLDRLERLTLNCEG